MSNELNRKEFHEAIDTTLSGLQENPFLAQRVMAQGIGKDDIIVKKNLSIGFVLVIVLMLLAVTALAVALLSGKEAVEEILVPIVTQSQEEAWTHDELDMISQQLIDQGFTVTEDIRQKLSATDPVYKEQLLRLFMKMDYGEIPASWPLEEQAWYDELLVALGLKDERSRVLPEGDEMDENKALEIAQSYILQKWNIAVANSEQYLLRVQYMITSDDNNQPVKQWDITYESTSGQASYVVTLTPDGHAVEDECYSIEIASPEESNKQIPVNADEDVMILMWQDDFYTVESLATFSDRFGGQVLSYENNWEQTRVLKAMLEIPYALPSSSEISPETAMSKAQELAIANGWTGDQLKLCRCAISYRKYLGEDSYYRICFKLNDGPENRAEFYQGKMPFGIVIYLNPLSGEAIRIQTLEQLDDFERYPEFPDPHDTIKNKGNG